MPFRQNTLSWGHCAVSYEYVRRRNSKRQKICSTIFESVKNQFELKQVFNQFISTSTRVLYNIILKTDVLVKYSYGITLEKDLSKLQGSLVISYSRSNEDCSENANLTKSHSKLSLGLGCWTTLCIIILYTTMRVDGWVSLSLLQLLWPVLGSIYHTLPGCSALGIAFLQSIGMLWCWLQQIAPAFGGFLPCLNQFTNHHS